MNNLINIIKDYKLDKSLILLYSGYFDSDNSGTNSHLINSNFFYLTGIDIPNLIVVYYKNSIKFIYDYSVNEWDDNNHKLKQIYNLYGKNTIIYEPYELSKFISIKNVKCLTLNNYASIPSMYSLFHDKIKNNAKFDESLLDNACNKNRQIKSKSEIKNISIATKYTIKAFRALLTKFKNKKFKYSYEIVNFMKCYWGQFNISKLAYNPICTSGSSNYIIHSNVYDYKLKSKQLILLDIACKYNNYCSDITRTFPVNGKFTKNQKIIYNIVLDINMFAINSIKIGMSWLDLNNLCYLRLYKSLLDIGLIVKKQRSNIEKIQAAKIFMNHSIGHSIGIDVHDVPFNYINNDMVITIEPGVYFNAHQYNNNNINNTELEKYFSIGGIRIEDVVLINSEKGSKFKNKTSAISLSPLTKSVNGIEKLMNL